MAPQFSKVLIESLVKEPVADFTVKVGSNAGDNVAGDLYAVKVEAVSGEHYNLVLKTFPEGNAELREYVQGFQLFALEMSIYTTLKERLEKVVKSYGGSEQEFPIPLPKYYGGLCDGENDFLCLEDMRPKGYKMPDKFFGLNFAEVSVVLKELGKFHALTYALIKYEGEKFFETVEGMRKLTVNFFTESSPMVDGMLETMFGNGLQVAKDVLSKRDPILAEKLKNAIKSSDVLPLMKKVGGLTDVKAFPVIVHGDFWVNNILIKYDEFGKPVSTKFIDFQQSRRGNIFDDLVYFMFASTTPKFRDEHLHHVLNTYYKSFTTTVDRLKVPPPSNFTFGVFMDTFFDCYKAGLVYMTYAIPLQLGVDPDADMDAEITDPSEKMTRRLTRMLEGSPRALERFESIVKEFAGLNLL